MHAAQLEYVVEGGLGNATSWRWIRQAQTCSVFVSTKYRAKYEQSEFWCFAKEMEMRQRAEVERVSERLQKRCAGRTSIPPSLFRRTRTGFYTMYQDVRSC
jgi:hypothetical protein